MSVRSYPNLYTNINSTHTNWPIFMKISLNVTSLVKV